MSGTSRISRNASPSRSASPSAAHRRAPTRRSRSRPCGYSRYHHHGCRRSRSCGLHKQAARTRRSLARRAACKSALLFRKPPHSAAHGPNPQAGEHWRGSMRRLAPRSGCLPCSHPSQLRQPASGLPPRRSKPAALASARSAVFPRAPQAPFRVLLRRGRDARGEREGTPAHPHPLSASSIIA